MVKLVAKRLGVARSRVSITKGGGSRHKVLAIEGMGRREALSRLRDGPAPKG